MREIGVSCTFNNIKEDEDDDLGYMYMRGIGV